MVYKLLMHFDSCYKHCRGGGQGKREAGDEGREGDEGEGKEGEGGGRERGEKWGEGNERNEENFVLALQKGRRETRVGGEVRGGKGRGLPPPPTMSTLSL